MFLIKQWKDGGTIMHSTLDVPNFLQETMAAFGQGAQIEHKIVDIEGCYPSMPKGVMKVAMPNRVCKTPPNDKCSLQRPRAV